MYTKLEVMKYLKLTTDAAAMHCVHSIRLAIRIVLTTVVALFISVTVSQAAETWFNPVSLKLYPGGTVSLPLQGPEFNGLTGAVVTIGDRQVAEVTARIYRQKSLPPMVVISAAAVAVPSAKYAVWVYRVNSLNKALAPLYVANLEIAAESTTMQLSDRSQMFKGLKGNPSAPEPAAFSALTPDATTFISGSPVRFTVQFSGAVSAAVTVALQQTSQPFGILTMPASVTVPAGQTSASFEVNSTGHAEDPVQVTLRATAGGVSKDVTLTMLPQMVTVKQLTLNAPTVVGGQTLGGSVRLNTAAREALSINLSVSQSGSPGDPVIARIVPSVIIPVGQTVATFEITTMPVSNRVDSGAFATAGSNGSSVGGSFSVVPVEAVIRTVSFSSASTLINSQVTATIALDRTIPVPGLVDLALVDLPTHDSNWMEPSKVTVPAGQSSVTVPVKIGGMLPIQATVRLTAKIGTSTAASAPLVVNQPQIADFTFSPSTANGGDTVTATVTLNAPAREAGQMISLSWRSTDATSRTSLTVPQSFTIPAGQTSGSVQFATPALGPMFRDTGIPLTSDYLNFTATLYGSGRDTVKYLMLKWPSVQSITVANPVIFVGSSTSITVTLTSPAGPAGFTVQLPLTIFKNLTSGVVILDLPGWVKVPAGQSSVTIPVQSIYRWGEGFPLRASIVAHGPQDTDPNRGQRVTIEVAAAEVTGLTVEPQQITGGQSASGTVQLSQAAPPGGAAVQLVTTASSAVTAVVPQQVIVPEGQSNVSFTIATTIEQGANAVNSVTIKAQGIGATKFATLGVTPP